MSEKPFLRVLRGENPGSLPFWFMRQAGRYLPEYREVRAKAGGFLDLCYTPELAAEVTLQPVRRFGMDAAILFSDILVVPHALGWEVSFLEGEGPKLPQFTQKSDLERLRLEKVVPHVAPVLETIRRVRQALPQEKALIGFAGAPWTVACYMVEGGGSKEFATVRRFAIEQRPLFSALMERLSEATIAYLSAQVEAGAEALQLFDSWAGVLPEAEFEAWVIAPAVHIVRSLKERYPHIPILAFPRLAGAMAPRYVQAVKPDAISVDFTLPLAFARDALQPHCVVQGNLDPLLLAADADAAIIQAKRIIAAWKDKPFIFNLGHGMVPHTPPSHVQALSDFLKNVSV